MATFPEQVEIEFLILADRAEILNGKMYMMGGGWNRKSIQNIDNPVAISMVIGILIPWNFTNELHHIRISLMDEDGTILQPTIEASVNMGRPPEAKMGQDFRAMAVINGQWKLPALGAYSFVASVENGQEKRVAFFANAPQPTGPR